jgi:AAA domain
MQSSDLGTLLSDIKSEQLHWLWEKRIPRGRLTILDGDPGLGKSLLTLDLAARITTGSPMPDGTPGVKGSVILIAPEDGVADTIKPRVEAAGGDPSRIRLLNAPG